MLVIEGEGRADVSLIEGTIQMTNIDDSALAGGNGNGAANQADAPQFRILAQYVKDLSFENPDAPASLRKSDEKPTPQRPLRPLRTPVRDRPDRPEESTLHGIKKKRWPPPSPFPKGGPRGICF